MQIFDAAATRAPPGFDRLVPALQSAFAATDITVPARTLDDICEASKLLDGDLHVLKVDAEGAEAEVLRSFDIHRWKPWVVVVEARSNVHAVDLEPLGYEPAILPPPLAAMVAGGESPPRILVRRRR